MSVYRIIPPIRNTNGGLVEFEASGISMPTYGPGLSASNIHLLKWGRWAEIQFSFTMSSNSNGGQLRLWLDNALDPDFSDIDVFVGWVSGSNYDDMYCQINNNGASTDYMNFFNRAGSALTFANASGATYRGAIRYITAS